MVSTFDPPNANGRPSRLGFASCHTFTLLMLYRELLIESVAVGPYKRQQAEAHMEYANQVSDRFLLPYCTLLLLT